MMIVNLKLTSACAIGVMAWAGTSLALTDAGSKTPTATVSSTTVSSTKADSGNPYDVIASKDIFRLNPIPPPPPPPEKPADLPKVYLSGIIKIGDETRVLFAIPSKDNKNFSYLNLAPNEQGVGDKDQTLELLNIHSDNQAVDVVVNGTAMTLSVLSNSFASSGAGSGGAANPGPRRGGFAPPAPPPAPAPVAAAASAGGGGAIIVGGGGSSATGGGYNSYSGGSGVTVSGGGSGFASIGSGGGVTVAGGSGSGLGAGSTTPGGTSNPINLLSGPQGSAQVGNPAPSTFVPPDQQALQMAAYNALHGGTIPLPPGVQAQIDGGTWNPHGNAGGGGK